MVILASYVRSEYNWNGSEWVWSDHSRHRRHSPPGYDVSADDDDEDEDGFGSGSGHYEITTATTSTSTTTTTAAATTTAETRNGMVQLKQYVFKA